MDINIPETNGKGKGWPPVASPSSLAKLFIPLLVFLLAIGLFGIQKLYTIEKARKPISIEYTATTTEAFSTSTSNISPNPLKIKDPPISQGGESIGSVNISSTTLAKVPVKTGVYVASRGSTVYYLPSCSGANRISDKNKIWFDTKAEAAKFGYKPAKSCKGL